MSKIQLIAGENKAEFWRLISEQMLKIAASSNARVKCRQRPERLESTWDEASPPTYLDRQVARGIGSVPTYKDSDIPGFLARVEA